MHPRIERSLTRLFYRIGYRIGGRPIETIAVVAIITAILFSGLTQLRQSTDIRDFVPDDAPSRGETMVAQQFARAGNGTFYSVQIVCAARDKGSLARPAHSAQLLDFLETATELNIIQGTRNFTYKSNCRPYCMVNEPLAAFLKACCFIIANITFLSLIKHIEVFPVLDEPFTYPQSTIYGTPLYIGNNVFEVTRNHTTGGIADFGLAVMRFMVVMEGPEIVQVWEEAVREMYERYDLLDLLLWSDGLLAEEINRLGYTTAPLIGISVVLLVSFFLITSLRADSVRSKPWEALFGIVIPVIAIGASFGLLAYLGIEIKLDEAKGFFKYDRDWSRDKERPVLAKRLTARPAPHPSRPWASSASTSPCSHRLQKAKRNASVLEKPATIKTHLRDMLVLSSSSRRSGRRGRPEMQPIIVATLFLVLSVGTDDAFIMMQAWDRTIDSRRGPPPPPKDSASSTCSTSTSSSLEEVPSVAERTAEMLAESGASIAITSLTNLLSFGVGAFSSTPAIRALCIYSSTAIVACFLFQIFLYTAFIALSGRRENQRYSSVLCCVKVHGKRKVSSFVKSLFDAANTLHDSLFNAVLAVSESILVRILLSFFMLCYWSTAIYGLTFLRSDLTVNKLALPDSVLIRFQERLESAQSEMQVLNVFVTHPPDFRLESARRRVKSMVRAYERALYSYGNVSTQFWLPDYEEYVAMMAEDEFTYTELPGFLETPGYTHWGAFVHLNSAACEANEPSCIDSFLLNTGFTTVVRFYERVPQLAEWRSIAYRYSDLGVVPFNENSLFTDQSSSIAFTVESSLGAALVFMAISCAFFIPSPSLVAAALVSIASVNLGVFGFLVLLGVELDPLSMAAMLMSVGFSVDYTAHISYHFYKSEEASPRARLSFALSSIGWPMVQCAASTILAVAPILARPSYIAHVFFTTVLLVVAIGVFHGLVFIPILLLATQGERKEKKEEGDCKKKGLRKVHAVTPPPHILSIDTDPTMQKQRL